MHEATRPRSREHGYDLRGQKLRAGVNAYRLEPQITSRSPGVRKHGVVAASPSAPRNSLVLQHDDCGGTFACDGRVFFHGCYS